MKGQRKKPDISNETAAKWQRIVDLIAEILGVPAVLVMKVEPPQIEVFVTSATIGNPYKRGERTDLNARICCETVLKQSTPHLVPNALEDHVWNHNPDIERGMTYYLGFPLKWPDNEIFGTVFALDYKDNSSASGYVPLISALRDLIEGDLRLIQEIYEREQANKELRRHGDRLRKAHDKLLESNDKLKDRIRKRIEELGYATCRLQEEIANRKQAEEVLRNERDKAQEYLDIAGVIIVAINADGDVVLINKRGCQVLGYDEAEVIGRNWFDNFLPDWMRNQVKAVFKKLLTGDVEPTECYENPVLTRQGYERLIAWHNTILKDAVGNTIGTLSSGEDITERREAEQALRRSEARCRAVFEASADGILIADIETKAFKYANPAICQLLGYSQEEILNLSVFDIHPKDSLDFVLDEFEAQARGKKALAMSIPCLRRDRTVVFADINTTAAVIDGIKCNIGFFRDITDRMIIEEELKQRTYELGERVKELNCLHETSKLLDREDLPLGTILQTLVDIMPLGWQYQDIACARLKIEDKEYKSTNFRSTRWKQAVDIFDSSKKIGNLEVHYLEKTPPHDEGPFLAEERLLLETIASRLGDTLVWRQAEEALKRSEEKYRLVSENIPVVVYSALPDELSTNMFVSGRIEELTGYTGAEFLENPELWSKIVHPDDRKYVWEEIEEHRREKSNLDVEYRIVTRDNTVKWIRDKATPAFDQNGQIIRIDGFMEDITEHKRDEEAKARLSTAVEQAAEAILVTDIDGTIIYVNPAFEKITGYSQAEVIGQNPRMLKSGRQDRAFYKQMWDTIKRGEVWSGRLSNRRKDGTIYEDKTTISPVRDAGGNIINFVALKRDITNQLFLEAQLRHAQKLESIGQLAAGIAHEINTPTQYVGDNIRFLQDAFNDLGKVFEKMCRLLADAKGGTVNPDLTEEVENVLQEADVEYLFNEIPRAIDQSLDGVDRVSNIVRAMKEFSHPGVEEKTAIDINKAIDSTITVARNEWKYVSEMETDFDLDLPPVPCLPGEFNQVILNLILNAAQAIAGIVGDGSSGKGKIRVSTRWEGDWAEIKVADSGSGIPENIRDRVFDPFFTTKEVGKGTGQGLAIAYSVIVDKHCGTISFDSQVSQGTTFCIRLPITKESVSLELEHEAGDLVC